MHVDREALHRWPGHGEGRQLLQDRMVKLVVRRQCVCASLEAGWPHRTVCTDGIDDPFRALTIVIRGGCEREGHIWLVAGRSAGGLPGTPPVCFG